MIPITVTRLGTRVTESTAPQVEREREPDNNSSITLRYLSTPKSCQAGLSSLRMSCHEASDDMSVSVEMLNPPAFTVVINAPTCVMFESALQRLQAIQATTSSSCIEKSDAAVSAALSAVYELDERGENRLAAHELMLFVESSLGRNSIAQANQLLASVNVSKLSSRSMIGMIRSTFRVNKSLPAWGKAYRDSWTQVRELGKSPEALFIGLPRVSEDEVASATK